ncbi:MAG TPA: endopeptidase La [Acidobacteriota bacterium]|nr:endopeptidase La [Acidobacteriota bacterium]
MNEQQTQSLPVLPIRNSVLFPYMLIPLSASRGPSVAAIEAALTTEEKELVVVAQRNAGVENPKQDDLYTIGTKAVIRKMARPRPETVEIIVQGIERVVLIRAEQNDPYLRYRVRPLPFPEDRGPEVEALQRAIIDLAQQALSLASPGMPVDLSQVLGPTGDPLRLVYALGSVLTLEVEKEQSVLAADTVVDALRLMHGYLSYEVKVLQLRREIATQAQTEMSKEQREYLLRQQLQAIRQQLGEKDADQAEVELLRERLEKADLPEHVQKEAERELQRLERLPAVSPERHVSRTYLELVLELPWNKGTEDIMDIQRAREILDQDHFDLEDVKERILEHLAVLKLNPAAKAPILCFVGPPGVGKTSLGQSIARALNREFQRMSLGGLHDESELRGHRRTYIGALPGRIIQAIRRAGVNNPVLMLDEVDKLGRDFRGDPAAALLEILDPEQNRDFRDNYLDLPFDLSHVFFITTANSLDPIPRPLLDRMEVLRLSGYSEEEKIEIARRYLIPRQTEENGLRPNQLVLPDEVLRKIISGYTREAGVRQLERAIGRVMRRVVLHAVEGEGKEITATEEMLADILGPESFFQEKARRELPAGVAAGLAWTETGGEVLYVEASLLPDGSGLTLTGQLGDVMKESAKAAQSYIWSHALDLGIDPAGFKNNGIHIHVPAGAIPKDGPSAGIAMATALASLYCGEPARSDTAMTGEITLTGLVLPVGGVKEKVLAARRAGIKRVILPRANQKDLRELPEVVRKELEIILVDRIEDVLGAAIPPLFQKLAVAK